MSIAEVAVKNWKIESIDGVEEILSSNLELIEKKVIGLEEFWLELLEFWIELAEIEEELLWVELLGEDEDDVAEIFLSDASDEIFFDGFYSEHFFFQQNQKYRESFRNTDETMEKMKKFL